MMEQIKIENLNDIKSYCFEQDLFKALHFTKQDPIWHAEGNVLTHTDMVVSALWEDADFKYELSKNKKEDLTWAACLHDIGKAKCIEEIDGRIRSHGHSHMSYRLAPQILNNIENLIPTRRANILNLVRYHGRPFHFMSDRTNSNHEIAVAVHSRFCYIRDLYLLAKADLFGRISSEKSDDISFDTLELYKETAKELDCWTDYYNFVNPTQFLLAYKGKLRTFEYVPYEQFKCNFMMLSGLPGAGKDTFINSQNHFGYDHVISLDDIRKELNVKPADNQGHLIQEAKKRLKVALAARKNIIFNATNLTANLRKKWLDIAAAYGALTSIQYIEPASLSEIKQRNENRENVVPENVWLKMLSNLELPQPHEANFVNLYQYSGE